MTYTARAAVGMFSVHVAFQSERGETMPLGQVMAKAMPPVGDGALLAAGSLWLVGWVMAVLSWDQKGSLP